MIGWALLKPVHFKCWSNLEFDRNILSGTQEWWLKEHRHSWYWHISQNIPVSAPSGLITLDYHLINDITGNDKKSAFVIKVENNIIGILLFVTTQKKNIRDYRYLYISSVIGVYVYLIIYMYRNISYIRRNKSQTQMFLVSSCSCLCPIQWSQVLSREWRCSWSSADRRCSNYIWVIDNFIAY